MEQNSKWYSSKGLLPSQLSVPQRLETFYSASFEEVSCCVVRWPVEWTAWKELQAASWRRL